MKLLALDSLKSGMVTAQDVYLPEGGRMPYVRANVTLTDFMLSEMRRLGILFVYVQGEEDKPAESPVQLPQIPKARPTIAPELRDKALGVLKDMFDSVSIGSGDIHEAARIVKQVDTVVGQLVDTLRRDSEMLVNIGGLRSYDEYTFHHSLSVAVISIAIGQYLGFNRNELRQVGMCAMMHDIGKTAVPIELIHKTSRLDNREFEVIKRHSSAGYDYLVKNGVGNEDLWRGVLHHHEKVDGSGYPDGIRDADIPLMSRILSVADVYDALTSHRPYRTPLPPAEAVEYVMGSVGSAFDYDMVEAFIKRLELYPTGGRVLLSDGRSATVVSCEYSLRPVVRLDTGETLDLYRDRQCLSVVISRLLG